MALNLLGSGSIAPDPGVTVLENVSSPGVYVAVFDLRGLAPCVFTLFWSSRFEFGSMADIWTTGEIDLGTDPPEGIVLPPIPVARDAQLSVNVISGIPGGTLDYDIFSL